MVRFVFDAIVFGLTLAIVLGFGPAFITLIQTSIHRGFRSAAWFATGVFLNDVLMVSLCVLTSIQVVANNDREMFFFSLGAGVILILFGIFTYTRKVKEDNFKGIKERTDQIKRLNAETEGIRLECKKAKAQVAEEADSWFSEHPTENWLWKKVYRFFKKNPDVCLQIMKEEGGEV